MSIVSSVQLVCIRYVLYIVYSFYFARLVDLVYVVCVDGFLVSVCVFGVRCLLSSLF